MRFLGQIVLLRVENAQVKHDDLALWFNDLSLDHHYLPPRTSPVNSFKKAATGATTKLTYDAPWVHKTATATVRWEDESHDLERIVRRAMRVVKVGGKAGQPTMVARVTFYKRNRRVASSQEKMRFQLERDKLDAAEVPILEKWLEDATRRYEAGQVWVDTDALRGCAREYLTDRLKAIKVRDGVYFVYRELEKEMKRLQTLVSRFGDECLFHPMEVIDREDHRAMLRGALDSWLAYESTALQRQLRALHQKNPRAIPRQSFAPLVTRYEEIMTMAHEYAEALGGSDLGVLDRLTDNIVTMRKLVR